MKYWTHNRANKLRVGDLVKDTSDGEVLLVVRIQEYLVSCYSIDGFRKYCYDKYNIHYLEVIGERTKNDLPRCP